MGNASHWILLVEGDSEAREVASRAGAGQGGWVGWGGSISHGRHKLCTLAQEGRYLEEIDCLKSDN